MSQERPDTGPMTVSGLCVSIGTLVGLRPCRNGGFALRRPQTPVFDVRSRLFDCLDLRSQHPAPTTEILPGQRLSPATAFKPGMDAHNRLPVGAVRVRRETHTGRVRAWVKGLSRMYGASGRCCYVRPGTARGARPGYSPPRP